jgi:excinuclease UvrABC nuclease subunit
VSRATDVLGISCKKRTAYISLLQIRGGNIVNEVSLKVRTKKGSEGDALQEFLVEYYSEASSIPDRLLLPFQLPEHRTIKAWFADKRADCVLTCSKRGQDGRLIKLAQSNAEKKIEAELVKRSVAYTMLKNEMSSQNKTTMDTSDIVNS